MEIIFPKVYCDLDPSLPLFFLAGPVKGGADWQHNAVEQLGMLLKNFYVVIPCRYDKEHPLVKYKVDGKEDTTSSQLTWERHYMKYAATKNGCLIFWLPSEDRNYVRTVPEPYAMDTRGELGEWRGQMKHDKNLKVVIGAKEGFLGLSQIQRNFNEALCCDFTIYKTIEETVDAAVRIAR
jgi:hypothetical protein